MKRNLCCVQCISPVHPILLSSSNSYSWLHETKDFSFTLIFFKYSHFKWKLKRRSEFPYFFSWIFLFWLIISTHNEYISDWQGNLFNFFLLHFSLICSFLFILQFKLSIVRKNICILYFVLFETRDTANIYFSSYFLQQKYRRFLHKHKSIAEHQQRVETSFFYLF